MFSFVVFDVVRYEHTTHVGKGQGATIAGRLPQKLDNQVPGPGMKEQKRKGKGKEKTGNRKGKEKRKE